MHKFWKTGVQLCLGLGSLLWIGTAPVQAITMRLGDVDNFGYSPLSIPGLQAPGPGNADQNNDGILSVGDILPDRNVDGAVATGRGDDYDYRSSAEKIDLNAQWTDVSLSTSFAERPGLADDVFFTFNFTVPTVGAFDYGVDHFLNIIAGDLDVTPFSVLIDGILTVPLVGVGGRDGLITLTHAAIPWSYLTDGVLTVDFLASREPYVAIDYVLLDTDVREDPSVTDPVVPEPATGLLTLLGVSGLAAWRRRRG